jgi:predicted nucleic acid-binding protein
MADAEQPEPRPGVLYVDTSALLKLLVREAESEAIETELLLWSKLATSIVTEIELPRAIARACSAARARTQEISRERPRPRTS